MKRIKLITLFAVIAVVASIGIFSGGFRSNAQSDDLLASVSKYKTWSRFKQKPLKGFEISRLKYDKIELWISPALFSSKRNDKDLVTIFSDLGKGLKKAFTPDKKPQGASVPTHNLFELGAVYVNNPAAAVMENDLAQFPVGSVIVREKNVTTTGEIPDIVIAMIKRENGFSKETGDWEYFTFSGSDLKLQKRETVGDCAKCHAQAKENDWVFREYLK